MGAAGAPVAGARGRVVMLVDNGVNGDSRVQKEAMSAAAAGWDVILLGRSLDGEPQAWQLGDAEVRLIPMPSPLTKRPHEFRRNWLHGPFAYPPTGIASHRAQRRRAWQADLRFRTAALRVAKRAGAGRMRLLAGGAALRIRARVVRMMGSWVIFRIRQAKRSQQGRRKLSGPWDRTYAFVWRTLLRERSWRKLEPRLWDFELAFGPVVDQLRPDIIHANDFYMIGVGARAKLRALAAGRQLKLVWDAHELVSGIKSRSANVRWLPAHIDHEKEFARYADAAVTVSEELADVLQRVHKLPSRPTVVLNAPAIETTGLDAPAPDIRALCGIGPNVPLMVYSGAAAVQRGLGDMVEALARLDGVHAGFVVAHPPSKYVQELVARAEELDVADRVHLLPYVPIEQIVPFLAGADIGVIPIHHYPNHEIALITKFFEYAHARLPMIVSDVRTMAATTRAIGLGEVFKAEDIEDLSRAVKAILADPQRYRAAYDRPSLLEGWTWEAQGEVLDDVYRRLLPHAERRNGPPDVSVIVPVYNAMPYLSKCLKSLREQTIGRQRMEVIAIDDGSTDESGALLDRFAQNNPGLITVVHQENSGGPAAPCNRGLELASGRYVFFLGADDFLGQDALLRLVDAADEHGADVVMGKMVGVRGRYVPTEIFRSTNLNVDPYDSALPFAISNTKLFRRDLIEKHGLRYDETLTTGSDQPFTLAACVRAERIVALADYEYYFAIRRRDRSNITYRSSHIERLRCTTEIMRYVTTIVEPGPRRDAIHHRHFTSELSKLIRRDFATIDRQTQEAVCAGIATLADEYLTEDIERRMDPGRRVRLTLARRGLIDDLISVIEDERRDGGVPLLVEGDRLYVGYRLFRDELLALPDELFASYSGSANLIAGRLALGGVAIDSRGAGGRDLVLTLHTRLDPSVLRVAAISMTLGDIAGQVSSNGAEIEARFPIAALMATSNPREGVRLPGRLQVAVHGETYQTRLVASEDVVMARLLNWRGLRSYRVNSVRGRNDQLVVGVHPVNLHRLAGRMRASLRRGRK